MQLQLQHIKHFTVRFLSFGWCLVYVAIGIHPTRWIVYSSSKFDEHLARIVGVRQDKQFYITTGTEKYSVQLYWDREIDYYNTI